MYKKNKAPLRDVVYVKSRGCRKLKRGNTVVPTLRAYMSLLVQYRIQLLCITTPPVMTFGALNNLSPGVLYSGGGVYNVPRWYSCYYTVPGTVYDCCV